ncbi:MAG: BamA/TamA family outer membrane protein [Polyangiaceae bacterium]
MRGFLQDSVVPQDVADELLAVDRVEQDRLLREVVLRGGNLVLNPRAELRIPLGDVWSTALFVDSGNLWLDPMQVRPFVWRYSAGSGLRANTPIGPLAFDYGINLDRRPWEDFGAFHFSVGLF